MAAPGYVRVQATGLPGYAEVSYSATISALCPRIRRSHSSVVSPLYGSVRRNITVACLGWRTVAVYKELVRREANSTNRSTIGFSRAECRAKPICQLASQKLAIFSHVEVEIGLPDTVAMPILNQRKPPRARFECRRYIYSSREHLASLFARDG
jgi:hypothetical protein